MYFFNKIVLNIYPFLLHHFTLSFHLKGNAMEHLVSDPRYQSILLFGSGNLIENLRIRIYVLS
jgi:hypothetical protein